MPVQLHAPRPRVIQLAGADDLPVLIRDPAQAHAKSFETKPGLLGAVVKPVMVVAVKGCVYAQTAGQLVNGNKTVGMCAGRFMGDKHVGAQF